MENFDVVVIGSGPGGYPAAVRAAQLGAKTAIIEREKLGGTCLNWGCIPTKAMIASSDLYAHMQHAADFGLSVQKTGFSYGAIVKRKNEVVKKLGGGVAQLLKANKVTVFNGSGSFVSRDRIAIDDGTASTEITADKVILATGSTSTMPGFLPKSPRVVDSRAFLDMKKLPASLIVLGGGVIGCELACMAAQLGTKVTIVELLDDIMMVLDKDVRRQIRQHMTKELGIDVMTGAALQNIRATKTGVSGTAGETKVEAALLLASVGRSPVTDGLALENAGLNTDERGCIEVDAGMRTEVATVFAIGDVTAGSTQLAHAATAQGITAAENACRSRQQPAETLVPACIFTSPEAGAVGLTEEQAAEQGRTVTVGKYMLAGLGRALAVGEPTGFVKWLADAETDQLLGAQAVGAHATELIAEAALAIRSELTGEELGRTIHCHPTFSESWMEAAHALHGTCIHQPPKRR